MRRARRIVEVLRGDENLTELVAQATERSGLERRIRANLPELRGVPFSVAEVGDRRVVICTDSPEWAMRLKLLAPKILSALAGNGREPLDDGASAGLSTLQVPCRALEVRVHPKRSAKSGRPRAAARKTAISASARRQIREAAHGIDDARLRSALERLASGTPDDDAEMP